MHSGRNRAFKQFSWISLFGGFVVFFLISGHLEAKWGLKTSPESLIKMITRLLRYISLHCTKATESLTSFKLLKKTETQKWQWKTYLKLDTELFRHGMLNTVLFTVREGVLQSGSSMRPENDRGLCSEKEVRTDPVSSSVCLWAANFFMFDFCEGLRRV